MKMVLMKEKLWKVVDEQAPNATDSNFSDWEAMDEQARATIVLAVEDNQLSHMMDKNTARKMWRALKKVS